MGLNEVNCIQITRDLKWEIPFRFILVGLHLQIMVVFTWFISSCRRLSFIVRLGGVFQVTSILNSLPKCALRKDVQKEVTLLLKNVCISFKASTTLTVSVVVIVAVFGSLTKSRCFFTFWISLFLFGSGVLGDLCYCISISVDASTKTETKLLLLLKLKR